MTKKLAEAFQRDMYSCSIQYKKKTRTTPTRYHQMIERSGGVGTARELTLAPGFQTGLERAAEYDCIELTAEYLIAYGDDGNYRTLFAGEVIEAAVRKLDALYQYRDALRGERAS